MNPDNEQQDKKWYVIHTNPRQEDRAEENLSAWGIKVFSPKLKEFHRRPYSGELAFAIKPLFPGYIFALFDVEILYHKVRYTRGIHNIVSAGNIPTAIDESIIRLIESRIGDDGLVRIGEDLRPGDEVVINDGLLNSLTGVFERTMRGSDRVMILLNTINYQAHIVIQKCLVKKVSR